MFPVDQEYYLRFSTETERVKEPVAEKEYADRVAAVADPELVFTSPTPLTQPAALTPQQ